MIDRDKFWDKARPIFHGPSQGQVDGTNAILDEWENRYLNADIRWLAYMLATAYWETNRSMKPVREAYYLGEPEPAESYRRQLRYYPYYGRGLVQLTWQSNYQRESQPDRVGVDLVSDPDRALEPRIAAAILMEGMKHGDFGGVGLAYWFSDNRDDPVGARHLVNGTDHAADIANIHRQFLAALQAARVTI